MVDCLRQLKRKELIVRSIVVVVVVVVVGLELSCIKV